MVVEEGPCPSSEQKTQDERTISALSLSAPASALVRAVGGNKRARARRSHSNAVCGLRSAVCEARAGAGSQRVATKKSGAWIVRRLRWT
jgi:hypothetical protein